LAPHPWRKTIKWVKVDWFTGDGYGIIDRGNADLQWAISCEINVRVICERGVMTLTAFSSLLRHALDARRTIENSVEFKLILSRKLTSRGRGEGRIWAIAGGEKAFPIGVLVSKGEL
jgi:hypothetical protein